MLSDLRLNQLAAVRGEPRERALLVGADEPRVTRDIGGENGGKPTLHGTPIPGTKTNPRAGRCDAGTLYGVSPAAWYMGSLPRLGRYPLGRSTSP